MSELVSISSLAEINPPNERPKDIELDVSFIPMADVTESARWINRQTRKAREVLSGFTSFKEGDVLFAKITPCMENGKGALAKGLKNGLGYGSTEFHVIRAKHDVSASFLNQILKYQITRERALAYFSGSAGQQRVSKDFFDKYLIPSFSFSEQNKIALILTSIDEQIESTERLIEKKKEIINGIYQDVFIFPVRDGAATILLEKIALPKGGTGFPLIYQGSQIGLPFIKVSDMNSLGNEKFITRANNYLERGVAESIGATIFSKGSIVFAKVGAALLLNRRRILVENTIIDNNMMGVTCFGIDTSFLYHFLKTVDFSNFVQPGAVPSVNQSHINKLCIPDVRKLSQIKVAESLDALDDELFLEIKMLEKLKMQKQGLMQDLLTGLIRVN